MPTFAEGSISRMNVYGTTAVAGHSVIDAGPPVHRMIRELPPHQALPNLR
jgi:hypothetical protein